jgi:histidinol-phosphate aminotransferase
MIAPKKLVEDLIRSSEVEPTRFYKSRLDRNERTHPFNEPFIQNIQSKLSGELLQVYPEPSLLYENFAEFLNTSPDALLFNNGSDQSIKSVFETYISPGDRILLHRPGYAMYPVYAKLFGAVVDFQDFSSSIEFNYEEYIETITSKYRMAVLENPNGFIGVAPPEVILKKFIERCEEKGVIALIDEAYFFFHEITASPLITSMENLIITRTFSKAFGLAGLRVGYLLSNPRNIDFLSRVKPVHEINSMAILVISELIKNPDTLYGFINETRISLQYLKQGLNEIGIDTSDSVANFLAAKIGSRFPTVDVSDIMHDNDILVRRPFREEHLKEWTRIGTAPMSVMERLLCIFKEFM